MPTIANRFNASQAEYTWIGSAYLLAAAAATPVWGNLSDIWGRKPILLLANLIFFVGSLVAAVSVSIDMLLIGRAIQGIGGGGLLILANICISDLFSMRYVMIVPQYVMTMTLEISADEVWQGSRKIFWDDWWSVGTCMCHRSCSGWSFHAESLLALVFLHQL